ncbi:MAG TPA: helix-turn-helix domain-containing protein [Ignavibacteriaceae bacterium]|nr:helix-turn-helix domain-containing protein [Ignavibacteriaceae bacterium]
MEQTTMTPQVAILTPEQLKTILKEAIEQTAINILPKPADEEVYLSTKEVQNFLKIKRTTVHHYINQGKLKPIRIGKKLLFKKADLIW